MLGPIFAQFALHLGLGLNLRKTVFVPLGDETLEAFRRELERLCPGWAAAPMRLYADYLGFSLGPHGEPLALGSTCPPWPTAYTWPRF